MGPDTSEALRRIIDQRLLTLDDNPQINVHNFFNDVIRRCDADSVPFDGRAALSYWWDLARLGVIALPGGNISGGLPGGFRELILTERGRRLLERGEKSPHNPAKYLDAVQQRVAAPDDIVMKHLDEAVGAWAAGLNRASAVMLGCACERLVLMLADKIVAAAIAPWAAKIKKKLGGQPTSVSRLFDDVRHCLMDLRGQKKLPAALGDALDRKLSAVFDHARGVRNESGHPTGVDVSAEDTEAGLLMFPGFYVLVNELGAHL